MSSENGNTVDRVLVSEGTRKMTFVPGSSLDRKLKLETEYSEWRSKITSIDEQLSRLHQTKCPRREELIKMKADVIRQLQRLKPQMAKLNRETSMGQSETLWAILAELKSINAKLPPITVTHA